MSRLQDALLGKDKAYAQGSVSNMVDLKYGGQHGWSPVLSEWVSSAAYKRQNVIPILLQAPNAFEVMPNKEYWYSSLKALVEQHPKTIDGLNAGLNVDTDSTAVGGGGQRQLEFTNVTEMETSVSMSWDEKYGMPISKFWRRYITYLMMDPNSKVAGISTLARGRELQDLLPDRYSFSMLFMEPDPHHVTVNKAWIVANMFPQSAGDIVGRRDLTAPLELQSIDITFGGIAQFGPGVDLFAQTVLNEINIIGASPMNREAFIGRISGDVKAANSGYAHTVKEAARGSVDFGR